MTAQLKRSEASVRPIGPQLSRSHYFSMEEDLPSQWNVGVLFLLLLLLIKHQPMGKIHEAHNIERDTPSSLSAEMHFKWFVSDAGRQTGWEQAYREELKQESVFFYECTKHFNINLKIRTTIWKIIDYCTQVYYSYNGMENSVLTMTLSAPYS